MHSARYTIGSMEQLSSCMYTWQSFVRKPWREYGYRECLKGVNRTLWCRTQQGKRSEGMYKYSFGWVLLLFSVACSATDWDGNAFAKVKLAVVIALNMQYQSIAMTLAGPVILVVVDSVLSSYCHLADVNECRHFACYDCAKTTNVAKTCKPLNVWLSFIQAQRQTTEIVVAHLSALTRALGLSSTTMTRSTCPECWGDVRYLRRTIC